MQINVAQLLKEPIGAFRDYEVSEMVDVAENGDDRRVEGTVRLLRVPRGILVTGELQAEVELICSRCLSSFDFPVTLNIEEEYLPTIDISTGVPLASPEEPGTFTIDEHHIIDLTEAMRQYTLLAIPMKPLCQADCAGLCPICGQNLNQGSCDCLVPAIDPRWSELSKLL